MKIIKFYIKNYRNIENLELDFNDLNVIIGQNNVGKSNILKALDIFFNWERSNDINRIIDISKRQSINENRYLASLFTIDDRIFINNDASKIIEFDAEIKFDQQELLDLIGSKIPKLRFQNERDNTKDWSHDEEINEIFHISIKIETKDGKMTIFLNEIKSNYVLFFSFIEKIIVCKDNTKGYFYTNYEKVAWDGPNRHGMNEDENITDKLIKYIFDENKFIFIPAIRNLQPEKLNNGNDYETNGNNIPNKIFKTQTTRGQDKTKLEELQTNLLALYGINYKIIAQKEEKTNKIEIDIDDFPIQSYGDGLSQSLITIFNLDSNHQFIAIEEPEAHLHFELQKKTYNHLKDISTKKQLFLNTHSPIFINSGENVNNFLLKRDNNLKLQISKVNRESDFNLIRKDLGLIYSDLFFSNLFLIVEGETEYCTFPLLAQNMGISLEDLGIRIANIKGDKKGPKSIKEFLLFTKLLEIPTYIILDNGQANLSTKKDDWVRANLIEEKNFIIFNKNFVDEFSDEVIVSAANKFWPDLNLKEEVLEKEKNEGKFVEAIISAKLNEKKINKERYKISLGKQIAEEIRLEREKQKDKYELTYPEQLIQQIVKELERRD